jgi:hypothetical protein
MEDFGALDEAAAEACQAKVAGSDIFVGLVGHLYGSRPKGKKVSYTELEYQEAKKREKPRLLFIASDDFPLTSNLREPDEAWKRQQRFRKQVGGERGGGGNGPHMGAMRQGRRARAARRSRSQSLTGSGERTHRAHGPVPRGASPSVILSRRARLAAETPGAS